MAMQTYLSPAGFAVLVIAALAIRMALASIGRHKG